MKLLVHNRDTFKQVILTSGILLFLGACAASNSAKSSIQTPVSSFSSTPNKPPKNNTPTSDPKVIWYGDVNKPVKSSFRQLNRQPGEAGTATTVNDPIHGKVWKINKPSGSKRSEFARTNGYIPKEGDKVYVGWRVKIDIQETNAKLDDKMSIFQLKTEGNGSQNHPVSIGYDGHTLSVLGITHDGNQNCVLCRQYAFNTVPMPENEWIDIVLGFYFSTDPKKGYVEVWINGKKQSLTNQNNQKQVPFKTLDTGEMYFKWGIYREISRPHNIDAYLDELRIAETFHDANPANYTKTGTYKY